MSDAPTAWATNLVTALEKALVEAQLTTAFPDEPAIVTLAVGKKECAFEIQDGQVSNPVIEVGQEEAVESGVKALRIPLSSAQFEQLEKGQLELSTAYMQGDVKPTGSSRALLLAVEIFDNPAVRTTLASSAE